MNKRNIRILAAIFIILVLVLLGAFYAYKRSSPNRLAPGSVEYRDPKLTSEEIKTFEDRVAQYENDLKNAKSKEDKYKLRLQEGLAYFTLGKYAEAREQYLKASEEIRDNPTVWAELYVVENAMQSYKSAGERLTKAIQLNPGSVQYWRWNIELHQGPLVATKNTMDELYAEALRRTGDNAEILSLYARYLTQQNDLPGAVQQWKKAMEQNPVNKAAYEQEIKFLQDKLK